MDHLRSGWKLANWPYQGADGKPHANLPRVEGKSLFETLEQSGRPDEETYIVWRGEHTFVILNVWPYTNGHVMVLPKKAVPSLLDMTPVIHAELWETVRLAMTALNKAMFPQGLNVGVNEGSAGGGSEPDHLHVHVVPRWDADTNFMTVVADVRILPMSLADSWRRLRDNWPV